MEAVRQPSSLEPHKSTHQPSLLCPLVEETAHLASCPAGPARWQVMRVVWCLEPLKRSSLAVQRVGWAGRAAVTCSPFFTLILAGRTQVQFVKVGTELWTGSKGEEGG